MYQKQILMKVEKTMSISKGLSLVLVVVFGFAGINVLLSLPCGIFEDTYKINDGPPRLLRSLENNSSNLVDILYQQRNLNVSYLPMRAGDIEKGGRRKLQFDASGRPTNLRLAFLGDSTCRHIFLSLSYYLLSGHHINFNNATRRLITGKFPTRKEHKQYILDSYNGTLDCDCYSPEGPFIPWGRTHKIWQNIYYHRGGGSSSSKDGSESFDGNFLSHITKPGYFEAHGHWEPSQIYANQTYRQSVQGKQYPVGKFSWAGDWEQTIRSYIARIVPKPDYVVINAGLWPHDLNKTTLRIIRNALDDHGMVGIYKTTNKKIDETTTTLSPHDDAGCRALHHCLDLSWTGHIRDKNEYLDKSHFGTNLNVNFTIQLLSLLKEISTTE